MGNQTWHGSPCDMGSLSGHGSIQYAAGRGGMSSQLKGGGMARSSSIEKGMLGKVTRDVSRDIATGSSPIRQQYATGGISVLRARTTFGAASPQAGSVNLPPGAVPNRG